MNRDLKTVTSWVLSAESESPPSVLSAAARLTKRPRKPSRAVAPGRSKAERDEQRRQVLAQIRATVFARAGQRCECCNSRTPAELHHLVSGGSRRHQESTETTAAVCGFCHLDLHRNKEHALLAMRRWATERGFLVALKVINRRLDKLREAQRKESHHA